VKRDKELIRLLLLQVRDGDQESLLASYPEDVQGFHAAFLVDEGYADGAAVRGHDGAYVGAAMNNLTSKGYDYLENLEAAIPTKKPSHMSLDVFISHTSADSDLAEHLIHLLQQGLRLADETIRCTSVDGYRLPAGASTDETLRREVRESKVFIGLITPASMKSAYVLFELGARWGAEMHFAPLLARGADAKLLRGPLSGFNALSAESEDQMHQLLEEVGKSLQVKRQSPASYGKILRTFVQSAAAKTQNPITEKASPNLDMPEYAGPLLKFVVANEGSFTPDEYAAVAKISALKAQHYGEELVRRKLMEQGYDEVLSVYFYLTPL
jgi:hypothetical protein